MINLSGGDLSQLSDEQRQKLAALGVDPAALAAAGAAGGGGGDRRRATTASTSFRSWRT